MRSGHRSAHPWVVIASAILAAGALILGWTLRSQRPVPEPLGAAGSPAGAHAHAETRPGAPS